MLTLSLLPPAERTRASSGPSSKLYQDSIESPLRSQVAAVPESVPVFLGMRGRKSFRIENERKSIVHGPWSVVSCRCPERNR
jgi:hypothetical protein